MADISAKQVNELRQRTGVGMMKCKDALVKTNGDMEAAVTLLREQGLAAADKKANRIAAEGAQLAVQSFSERFQSLSRNI